MNQDINWFRNYDQGREVPDLRQIIPDFDPRVPPPNLPPRPADNDGAHRGILEPAMHQPPRRPSPRPRFGYDPNIVRPVHRPRIPHRPARHSSLGAVEVFNPMMFDANPPRFEIGPQIERPQRFQANLEHPYSPVQHLVIVPPQVFISCPVPPNAIAAHAGGMFDYRNVPGAEPGPVVIQDPTPRPHQARSATGTHTVTASHTQPSTSGVSASAPHAQPSTSGMQAATARVQPSTSGMQAQPSASGLQTSTSRGQPSTSRVQLPASHAQTSTSGLQTSTSSGKPSTSRVQAPASLAQSSTSGRDNLNPDARARRDADSIDLTLERETDHYRRFVQQSGRLLDQFRDTTDEHRFVDLLRNYRTLLLAARRQMTYLYDFCYAVMRQLYLIIRWYKEIVDGTIDEYSLIMEDILATYFDVIRDFLLQLETNARRSGSAFPLGKNLSRLLHFGLFNRWKNILQCLFKMRLYLDEPLPRRMLFNLYEYFALFAKADVLNGPDLMRIYISWHVMRILNAKPERLESLDVEMTKKLIPNKGRRLRDLYFMIDNLENEIRRDPRFNLRVLLGRYWDWWLKDPIDDRSTTIITYPDGDSVSGIPYRAPTPRVMNDVDKVLEDRYLGITPTPELLTSVFDLRSELSKVSYPDQDTPEVEEIRPDDPDLENILMLLTCESPEPVEGPDVPMKEVVGPSGVAPTLTRETPVPKGAAATLKGEAAAHTGEVASPTGEAASPTGEATAPTEEAAELRGEAVPTEELVRRELTQAEKEVHEAELMLQYTLISIPQDAALPPSPAPGSMPVWDRRTKSYAKPEGGQNRATAVAETPRTPAAEFEEIAIEIDDTQNTNLSEPNVDFLSNDNEENTRWANLIGDNPVDRYRSHIPTNALQWHRDYIQLITVKDTHLKKTPKESTDRPTIESNRTFVWDYVRRLPETSTSVVVRRRPEEPAPVHVPPQPAPVPAPIRRPLRANELIVISDSSDDEDGENNLPSTMQPNEPMVEEADAVELDEPIVVEAAAVERDEPMVVEAAAEQRDALMVVEVAAVQRDEPILFESAVVQRDEPVIVQAVAVQRDEPMLVEAAAVQRNEPIVVEVAAEQREEPPVVEAAVISSGSVAISSKSKEERRVEPVVDETAAVSSGSATVSRKAKESQPVVEEAATMHSGSVAESSKAKKEQRVEPVVEEVAAVPSVSVTILSKTKEDQPNEPVEDEVAAIPSGSSASIAKEEHRVDPVIEEVVAVPSGSVNVWSKAKEDPNDEPGAEESAVESSALDIVTRKPTKRQRDESVVIESTAASSMAKGKQGDKSIVKNPAARPNESVTIPRNPKKGQRDEPVVEETAARPTGSITLSSKSEEEHRDKPMIEKAALGPSGSVVVSSKAKEEQRDEPVVEEATRGPEPVVVLSKAKENQCDKPIVEEAVAGPSGPRAVPVKEKVPRDEPVVEKAITRSSRSATVSSKAKREEPATVSSGSVATEGERNKPIIEEAVPRPSSGDDVLRKSKRRQLDESVVEEAGTAVGETTVVSEGRLKISDSRKEKRDKKTVAEGVPPVSERNIKRSPSSKRSQDGKHIATEPSKPVVVSSKAKEKLRDEPVFEEAEAVSKTYVDVLGDDVMGEQDGEPVVKDASSRLSESEAVLSKANEKHGDKAKVKVVTTRPSYVKNASRKSNRRQRDEPMVEDAAARVSGGDDVSRKSKTRQRDEPVVEEIAAVSSESAAISSSKAKEEQRYKPVDEEVPTKPSVPMAVSSKAKEKQRDKPRVEDTAAGPSGGDDVSRKSKRRQRDEPVVEEVLTVSSESVAISSSKDEEEQRDEPVVKEAPMRPTVSVAVSRKAKENQRNKPRVKDAATGPRDSDGVSRKSRRRQRQEHVVEEAAAVSSGSVVLSTSKAKEKQGDEPSVEQPLARLSDSVAKSNKAKEKQRAKPIVGDTAARSSEGDDVSRKDKRRQRDDSVGEEAAAAVGETPITPERSLKISDSRKKKRDKKLVVEEAPAVSERSVKSLPNSKRSQDGKHIATEPSEPVVVSSKAKEKQRDEPVAEEAAARPRGLRAVSGKSKNRAQRNEAVVEGATTRLSESAALSNKSKEEQLDKLVVEEAATIPSGSVGVSSKARKEQLDKPVVEVAATVPSGSVNGSSKINEKQRTPSEGDAVLRKSKRRQRDKPMDEEAATVLSVPVAVANTVKAKQHVEPVIEEAVARVSQLVDVRNNKNRQRDESAVGETPLFFDSCLKISDSSKKKRDKKTVVEKAPTVSERNVKRPQRSKRSQDDKPILVEPPAVPDTHVEISVSLKRKQDDVPVIEEVLAVFETGKESQNGKQLDEVEIPTTSSDSTKKKHDEKPLVHTPHMEISDSLKRQQNVKLVVEVTLTESDTLMERSDSPNRRQNNTPLVEEALAESDAPMEISNSSKRHQDVNLVAEETLTASVTHTEMSDSPKRSQVDKPVMEETLAASEEHTEISDRPKSRQDDKPVVEETLAVSDAHIDISDSPKRKMNDEPVVDETPAVFEERVEISDSPDRSEVGKPTIKHADAPKKCQTGISTVEEALALSDAHVVISENSQQTQTDKEDEASVVAEVSKIPEGSQDGKPVDKETPTVIEEIAVVSLKSTDESNSFQAGPVVKKTSTVSDRTAAPPVPTIKTCQLAFEMYSHLPGSELLSKVCLDTSFFIGAKQGLMPAGSSTENQDVVEETTVVSDVRMKISDSPKRGQDDEHTDAPKKSQTDISVIEEASAMSDARMEISERSQRTHDKEDVDAAPGISDLEKAPVIAEVFEEAYETPEESQDDKPVDEETRTVIEKFAVVSIESTDVSNSGTQARQVVEETLTVSDRTARLPVSTIRTYQSMFEIYSHLPGREVLPKICLDKSLFMDAKQRLRIAGSSTEFQGDKSDDFSADVQLPTGVEALAVPRTSFGQGFSDNRHRERTDGFENTTNSRPFVSSVVSSSNVSCEKSIRHLNAIEELSQLASQRAEAMTSEKGSSDDSREIEMEILDVPQGFEAEGIPISEISPGTTTTKEPEPKKLSDIAEVTEDNPELPRIGNDEIENLSDDDNYDTLPGITELPEDDEASLCDVDDDIMRDDEPDTSHSKWQSGKKHKRRRKHKKRGHKHRRKSDSDESTAASDSQDDRSAETRRASRRHRKRSPAGEPEAMEQTVASDRPTSSRGRESGVRRSSTASENRWERSNSEESAPGELRMHLQRVYDAPRTGSSKTDQDDESKIEEPKQKYFARKRSESEDSALASDRSESTRGGRHGGREYGEPLKCRWQRSQSEDSSESEMKLHLVKVKEGTIDEPGVTKKHKKRSPKLEKIHQCESATVLTDYARDDPGTIQETWPREEESATVPDYHQRKTAGKIDGRKKRSDPEESDTRASSRDEKPKVEETIVTSGKQRKRSHVEEPELESAPVTSQEPEESRTALTPDKRRQSSHDDAPSRTSHDEIRATLRTDEHRRRSYEESTAGASEEEPSATLKANKHRRRSHGEVTVAISRDDKPKAEKPRISLGQQRKRSHVDELELEGPAVLLKESEESSKDDKRRRRSYEEGTMSTDKPGKSRGDIPKPEKTRVPPRKHRRSSQVAEPQIENTSSMVPQHRSNTQDDQPGQEETVAAPERHRIRNQIEPPHFESTQRETSQDSKSRTSRNDEPGTSQDDNSQVDVTTTSSLVPGKRKKDKDVGRDKLIRTGGKEATAEEASAAPSTESPPQEPLAIFKIPKLPRSNNCMTDGLQDPEECWSSMNEFPCANDLQHSSNDSIASYSARAVVAQDAQEEAESDDIRSGTVEDEERQSKRARMDQSAEMESWWPKRLGEGVLPSKKLPSDLEESPDDGSEELPNSSCSDISPLLYETLDRTEVQEHFDSTTRQFMMSKSNTSSTAEVPLKPPAAAAPSSPESVPQRLVDAYNNFAKEVEVEENQENIIGGLPPESQPIFLLTPSTGFEHNHFFDKASGYDMVPGRLNTDVQRPYVSASQPYSPQSSPNTRIDSVLSVQDEGNVLLYPPAHDAHSMPASMVSGILHRPDIPSKAGSSIQKRAADSPVRVSNVLRVTSPQNVKAKTRNHSVTFAADLGIKNGSDLVSRGKRRAQKGPYAKEDIEAVRSLEQHQKLKGKEQQQPRTNRPPRVPEKIQPHITADYDDLFQNALEGPVGKPLRNTEGSAPNMLWDEDPEPKRGGKISVRPETQLYSGNRNSNLKSILQKPTSKGEFENFKSLKMPSSLDSNGLPNDRVVDEQQKQQQQHAPVAKQTELLDYSFNNVGAPQSDFNVPTVISSDILSSTYFPNLSLSDTNQVYYNSNITRQQREDTAFAPPSHLEVEEHRLKPKNEDVEVAPGALEEQDYSEIIPYLGLSKAFFGDSLSTERPQVKSATTIYHLNDTFVEQQRYLEDTARPQIINAYAPYDQREVQEPGNLYMGSVANGLYAPVYYNQDTMRLPDVSTLKDPRKTYDHRFIQENAGFARQETGHAVHQYGTTQPHVDHQGLPQPKTGTTTIKAPKDHHRSSVGSSDPNPMLYEHQASMSVKPPLPPKKRKLTEDEELAIYIQKFKEERERKSKPSDNISYPAQRQMSIADLQRDFPKVKTLAARKLYPEGADQSYYEYPQYNDYSDYGNKRSIMNVYINGVRECSANYPLCLMIGTMHTCVNNNTEGGQQQAEPQNQQGRTPQEAPASDHGQAIQPLLPAVVPKVVVPQEILPPPGRTKRTRKAASAGVDTPPAKRGRGRPRKNPN